MFANCTSDKELVSRVCKWILKFNNKEKNSPPKFSLIAQLEKNPCAMQETPVQFLGWEDPLEKGKDTHSSTLGLPS